MPDYILRTHSDRQRVAEMLTQLAMDKPWRVSLTPYKSRRSSEQNNRAWALYRAIADETGYTAGEVHAICKAKFGEPRVIKMGDVEVTEWSTRDKDVAWMADYITRLEAWAAQEMGIALG
jgi:hypothetical protein